MIEPLKGSLRRRLVSARGFDLAKKFSFSAIGIETIGGRKRDRVRILRHRERERERKNIKSFVVVC